MAKKRAWTLVMVFGLMLILGSAGLMLYNMYTTAKAGESSDLILSLVVDAIPHSGQQENAAESEAEPEAPSSGQPETPDEGPAQPEAMDLNREEVLLPLTVVEVDGRDYVGVLTIPTLELQLPIQNEFTYPNLRVSPARYYGDLPTHDLVICAHNYTTHFGRLRSLHVGDPIQFVDMTGKVYAYEVSVVEIVDPYAIEDVTNGAWDLTLFTCTVGGRTRVVVRCDRLDKTLLIK